ncbi:MAG: acyl carrier protein [Synergistaceae bacterium]|jgi:acyl carrier protein|nr:acyl carrier protein [Synergistaceae bacterium]
MRNDERIIGIVAETLGVSVSGDSSIGDVAGWDSLKTLQIVMALDEAGYGIPIEKIADVKSVRDILTFVKE